MNPVTSRKQIIVCIEEAAEILQAAQAIFDLERYDIISVTSGSDMLEELRRLNPVVILVALGFHNTDGWEIYQRIKFDPDLKRLRVCIISPEAHSIMQLLHA